MNTNAQHVKLSLSDPKRWAACPAAVSTNARATLASRELIAEWTRSERVGIWSDCSATIRLYSDRALYKGKTVRWAGNSGSLANDHRRITGRTHAQLLALALRQAEDGADYTDEAFEWVYTD